MDDVWFAPGFTRRDHDAFLAALSLHGRGEPPLLAVARGGDDVELVVASRTLFALFAAGTGAELSDRLLKGGDPGATRLASLSQSLPLQGAARLERLRFSIGPSSEIITFLCRRITHEGGAPVFLAAALGLRAGLVLDRREGPTLDGAAPRAPTPSALHPPLPSMTVQAIQATLRTRWPTSRTIRFLWQTDANGTCTFVAPPLAEVVGVANGDLVGRNLADLAATIDPSGRLATALAKRQTWSGLQVAWPIADAPAAVDVSLGAIPAADRDLGFEGYRGYGVIHLDRIASAAPTRFPTLSRQEEAAGADNVVPFPNGAKTLSPEDQRAFATLGEDLRQQAGLDVAALPPLLVDAPTPSPAAPNLQPDPGTIGANARAVLDRIAAGLLVSRDNVPIFANRHLLDLLGFADEDALHAAGGMRHVFGEQPGNASGTESIGLRAHDGSIVPVNARMQCIEWDGLPATMLTLQKRPTTSDVPLRDEIAAPTAPAASGEIDELRAILETATDGVAVMDGECLVVSLNRSGEALFGRDRDAVIGKPFLELFAPQTQSLVTDYIDGLKKDPTRRLLNDGREILVNHRDGTIPVFMTLGRLGHAEPATEGSQVGRFCALFRDLTHWKQVEAELAAAKADAERASALKSDFLAKVSHEIRTPLNAIIGFAEVMMDERLGPLGSQRYKDYLRDIHGSGTHVMSLVNDLLDLSKIEAGKMELAIEPIDVNKVVNECVSLMQPQASRERVILRLSLASGLAQIKADPRSLRQILLNLLSNAVKFNEPGGQVIVATTTDSDHVVVRIRDTGHGMSEEDIKAALEPFRQLGSTEAQRDGTGLGLPLTKALVEANHASLSIRSRRDQGTLVEVAFPSVRVAAG